jgi:hypothetical protein
MNPAARLVKTGRAGRDDLAVPLNPIVLIPRRCTGLPSLARPFLLGHNLMCVQPSLRATSSAMAMLEVSPGESMP